MDKKGGMLEREIRKQLMMHGKVQNLMCRVNEETLMEAHRRQERNKESGVDGVSKDDFEEELKESIMRLVENMKRFAY